MWLSPREQAGLARAQSTAPDGKRQSGGPLGAEQEGQTAHWSVWASRQFRGELAVSTYPKGRERCACGDRWLEQQRPLAPNSEEPPPSQGT